MSTFAIGVILGLGIGFAAGVIFVGLPALRALESARDHANRLLRDSENVAMRARRGGL